MATARDVADAAQTLRDVIEESAQQQADYARAIAQAATRLAEVIRELDE